MLFVKLSSHKKVSAGRWKSKNQEVFGVLFVKLSSHKKVSAGVGRVAPQIIFAQCSEKGLRPFSCLR